MKSYKIRWKNSAIKELKKLDKNTIKKILNLVEFLANNPYLTDSRKLTGFEHTYRVRTGNYRVIYTVQSSDLVIEIVRIGHRKDIYKSLN